MKIALVGPQYPDSFAKCISITLMEMGHDVFTIDEHEILPSAHLPTSIKMHDVFKIKAWENILIKGSPSFEKWVYRSLCIGACSRSRQALIPTRPALRYRSCASHPPHEGEGDNWRYSAKKSRLKNGDVVPCTGAYAFGPLALLSSHIGPI